MAARQDQGLQVLLIVFVLLWIVFAALSYFFYRSYSEAEQRADTNANARDEAQGTANRLQTENQSYRQMMGFDPFDNFDDVQTAYDEDMQRFGATFDENRRFYRDILEYIYEESEKITAREVAAKDQVKLLKDSLLAVESQKERQVLQFKRQMEQAQEDAASQRTRFERDRRELETTKKELLDNLEQQRTKYDAQLAQRDASIKDLGDKLAKLERALQNALERIPRPIERFEVADGRVTWVTQNGTVWVNLGASDALRPQVTFSVFDTDRKEDVGAKRKGSIEVTRILGDHMAEARVTEDDPHNPILTGDVIYSQVWSRGDKLHFAMTGFIDIDGDGRSDLDLARDLIQLNGGIVDAYLAEDGKIEGHMSVNTRYLVLGTRPEDPIKAVLQQGWAEMSDEAATYGVEAITLYEFLNQMGYVRQERVVGLGRGAQSRDFAPKAQDNLRSEGASGLFRPRTPVNAPSQTPY